MSEPETNQPIKTGHVPINPASLNPTKPQPNSPTFLELQNISFALTEFQNSFNNLQLHLNTLKLAVDGLIIANNQSQNSQKSKIVEKSLVQESSTLLDIGTDFPPISAGLDNGVDKITSDSQCRNLKTGVLALLEPNLVKESSTLLDIATDVPPSSDGPGSFIGRMEKISQNSKIEVLASLESNLVQESSRPDFLPFGDGLSNGSEGVVKSSNDGLALLEPTLIKKSSTLLDVAPEFPPIIDGLRNSGGDAGNLSDVLVRELRTSCETMNCKRLRRVLVMNLEEIGALRLEVPKALKYAPNAAKLVLGCSGRFFLQGSKAFMKGSPMVKQREASVLILESFMLMEGGGDESRVNEGVKEEADRAAMLWRKRMVGEGGIMKACEIDARGLLLLIGCYGVPEMFKTDDVRDLIRAANVRSWAGTLRRSGVLMAAVPEIIEGMLKSNLEVDAIDVAYTFRYEEKCDIPTIMTLLFQKFRVPSKKGKKSSISPAAVNEVNKKQLHVLKSFVKCLECHKIDSSNPLRKVHQKISSLEKDISEYDKEMGEEKAQKRKAEAEAERRYRFQEGKRSRYTGQGPHHLKATHNSQRSLADSGIAGHVNGYSGSQSMFHAQAEGNGYAAPGAYGGMVIDPSGHVMNHGVQPYGWHEDPTLSERVVSHSYAAQPPSTSMSSLYWASPSSLEGYAYPSGLSIAVPNRGATTDLYQFADNIVDDEHQPNYTSYGSHLY